MSTENGPIRRVAAATLLAAALALAGCAAGEDGVLERGPTATTAGPDRTDPPPTTAPPGTAAPTTTVAPGNRPPAVPRDPAHAADQINAAEATIRDPGADPDDVVAAARASQVAYRVWSHRPDWDEAILEALDASARPVAERHLAARRELLSMHSELATRLPAWEIVAPEDPDGLLDAYRRAERDTGIPWQHLAAINLVETGFGRIRGVSSAGAQGPMQFMPSTWALPGIGEGDIHDPEDAIAAAARYLVDRGGPEDMDAALWGYNNHTAYVRAVQHYAALMMEHERAFYGLYHWDIYYATELGDLLLPVGYISSEPIPAEQYLSEHPERVVPRG